MADNRYQIKTWRGFRFDRYTIFNLEQAEAKLGLKFAIAQGSYNRGGVSASAGTHDGGGAVDIGVRGMSEATIKRVVRALRSQGFAAWFRPAIKGLWGPHIHAILIGNTKASSGAKNQVTAYKRLRNGLANNARDLSWRPAVIRNAPYTATKIRIAAFNLPDEEKIPNASVRIAAAVKVLKSGAGMPGIIGWNELVGIKSIGKASAHATAVDKALGKNYHLVIPTTLWNENYVSFDSTKYRKVHQYADSILRSASGGRHLTRVVFEDKKSGVVFAVGLTHLVNGTTANNQKDRQVQAQAALKSMKAVSEKHDHCPFVILGDFNMPDPPAGFTAAGMKNARVMADESDNRTASTYTTYSKDVPSKSPSAIIDQLHVSADFWVHAYSSRQDLVAGKFRKPRPSDHQPVAALISAI